MKSNMQCQLICGSRSSYVTHQTLSSGHGSCKFRNAQHAGLHVLLQQLQRGEALEAGMCRRNKWAVFNILLLVVALGVIGTSTWALVEGIKTTDGKVNDFWTLISDLEDDVSLILTLFQDTGYLLSSR